MAQHSLIPIIWEVIMEQFVWLVEQCSSPENIYGMQKILKRILKNLSMASSGLNSWLRQDMTHFLQGNGTSKQMLITSLVRQGTLGEACPDKLKKVIIDL